MDANGSNQVRITDGGPNPNNEEPHGPYPIGIDADPDLSPDNKKIVFSRLKTGKQNEPFGVYELVLFDCSLDSWDHIIQVLKYPVEKVICANNFLWTS